MSSLAQELANLSAEKRAEILASLTPQEQEALQYEWRFWARAEQLPPDDPDWRFWLILAGRGFGKTRSGAQWVIDQVERHGARRVALVAETAADARDVMIEGNSGILACSPPWNRPTYEPTKRRLTWPNGAIATSYASESYDQLRGPQHDCAWVDELAKYRYSEEVWNELLLGLRLGSNPRAVITTTPRPIKIIRALVKDPLCRITRGSTYDNAANLADQYIEAITKRYQGTRLGRQELNAEILDDAPGALWKREQLEALHTSTHPELVRIVVAIDPSVSSTNEDAETGIVVAGKGTDGLGYVLADGTMPRPTPDAWGRKAVELFDRYKADRILGEVNNGGDLVESNLRTVRPGVPFKKVHASRGKQVRAEPISALYEQSRVKHVGYFPQLEDQMCQWEPGESTFSPNRVDALVWALTELMGGSGPAHFDARFDRYLPHLRI